MGHFSSVREKSFHPVEVEWHSFSWVPPRGTVRVDPLGSYLVSAVAPRLLSGLRQNRILASFATHVARTGLVLRPLLPASDQGNGTNSAGNVFMLLGIAM